MSDIQLLVDMDLSQQKRIKILLEWRGEAGAFVYELNAPRPGGLGIAQYNARIFELRKEGLDITDDNGHFVLHKKGQSTMF